MKLLLCFAIFWLGTIEPWVLRDCQDGHIECPTIGPKEGGQ
jgi:hypothetical protein